MAWRIENHIEEGEIDNTVRGRVTGWLKLTGVESRVELDLTGNCKPDLAGWKFRIVRTEPVPEWDREYIFDPIGFESSQTGEVMEITGANLVRYANCSDEELIFRLKQNEPPPMPWTPTFAMEWWSDRNGPVRASDVRLAAERMGQRAFELSEEEYERDHARIMDDSGKLDILDQARIVELGDGIFRVEFDDEAESEEVPFDDEIEEAFEAESPSVEQWQWNDGETWQDDLEEQQREFEEELQSGLYDNREDDDEA